MMTADLILRAGESSVLTVGPIADDDTGAPVTLSGVELDFVVKRNLSDTDAEAVVAIDNADMTVVPDGVHGDSVNIPFDAAMTADLLGTYAWVLRAEDITGGVRYFAGGALVAKRVAWAGA